MPKPIAIIYFNPDAFTINGGLKNSILEVNEIFRELLPDYHTMAIPSYRSQTDDTLEDVRLEVFHEKDFGEIELEELKKTIMDTIEQQKTINHDTPK